MTDDDPKPSCPSCGSAEADWLLCHRCVRQLRWALQRILPEQEEPKPIPRRRVLVCAGHACVMVELPTVKGQTGRRQTLPWEDQAHDWTGIADQLTASLARLSRKGSQSGGRSAEHPLPFDMGSSGAIGDLRNCMAGWVRILHFGQKVVDGKLVGEDWPEDTLAGMAQWLLDRMQRIRGHEAAAEIKREIVEAVGRALRMIDSPPQRQLIGRCPVCGKDDVYADPGAEVGVCRQCEAVVADVQDKRAGLMADARDRLATKQQILKAIPSMYGVTITDTRFRKWVSRGRIAPPVMVACTVETKAVDLYRVGEKLHRLTKSDAERLDEGEILFRIGDVLDLANDERIRQAAPMAAAGADTPK